METDKKEIKEVADSLEEITEPVVETPKKKKMSIGKVIGGSLNLRAEPDSDSDVIYVLQNNDTVIVDMDGSTDGFYKVTANGLVGYCVRNFIAI